MPEYTSVDCTPMLFLVLGLLVLLAMLRLRRAHAGDSFSLAAFAYSQVRSYLWSVFLSFSASILIFLSLVPLLAIVLAFLGLKDGLSGTPSDVLVGEFEGSWIGAAILGFFRDWVGGIPKVAAVVLLAFPGAVWLLSKILGRGYETVEHGMVLRLFSVATSASWLILSALSLMDSRQPIATRVYSIIFIGIFFGGAGLVGLLLFGVSEIFAHMDDKLQKKPPRGL